MDILDSIDSTVYQINLDEKTSGINNLDFITEGGWFDSAERRGDACCVVLVFVERDSERS